MHQNLQNLLNDLIEREQIDDFFNLLEQHLYPADSAERTTFTLLKNQWKRQQQEYLREGEIPEKQRNNLIFRLIGFGGEVVQKRRSEQYLEKITVVCYDKNGKDKMAPYFNPRYFVPENIHYHCFTDTAKPRLDLAKVSDFVVFDNYHVPVDGDNAYQRDLLADYLNAREAQYVLSFGGWVFDNDEIRPWMDKFYAANSPISLYARIRELREYIKITSP